MEAVGRCCGTDEETTLGASWEWDNEGRMTRATYPLNEAVYGYSYDTMGRLSTASTTGPQWGQAYAYDGWGNLAGKTETKGSGPVFGVSYDGLTTGRNGLTYDAAGNVLMSNVYDAGRADGELRRPVALRLRSVEPAGARAEVRRNEHAGRGGILRSGGERMGTYRRAVEHSGRTVRSVGRRVKSGTKWATYWRDSTGPDYAMRGISRTGGSCRRTRTRQRGYRACSRVVNRYAYVMNNPVNYGDPSGLMIGAVEGGVTFSTTVYALPISGDIPIEVFIAVLPAWKPLETLGSR